MYACIHVYVTLRLNDKTFRITQIVTTKSGKNVPNHITKCVPWIRNGNNKIRIHFSNDDDCILFLKGIMKVKESLIVQLRKQVHLSQSRWLLLCPRGDKLCSILCFANLLGHTFHIGKRTPGRKKNGIVSLSVSVN